LFDGQIFGNKKGAKILIIFKGILIEK